jgi:hypothetical protein
VGPSYSFGIFVNLHEKTGIVCTQGISG